MQGLICSNIRSAQNEQDFCFCETWKSIIHVSEFTIILLRVKILPNLLQNTSSVLHTAKR